MSQRKWWQCRSLAPIALVLTAAAQPADELQRGIAAFDRGDYASSLRILLPLAQAGSTEAQLKLGFIYEMGLGVEENDRQAAEWFSLAAFAGNPSAQLMLGLMYDMGTGVPQDVGRAVEWIQRAARQGDTTAQGYLGSLYTTGRGVSRDPIHAYAWYTLAASHGDDLAAFDRSVVAHRMTKNEIAQGARLARQLARQIERGHNPYPEH